MTSIQGRSRPHQEHPSVALLDSSLPPKSELSKQPIGPSKVKPPVTVVAIAATNVIKYTKNDLQRIFKTILKAQTLAPVPASTLVTSKESRNKLLKARSSGVYCRKFQMDCYNFCQQSENYFTIAEATETNRISFVTSLFRNRSSFCWQQYKRKQDVDNSVPVM